MKLNSLSFYPSEAMQTGISGFTRQNEAATYISSGLFLDDPGTIAGYGKVIQAASANSNELQATTVPSQAPARDGSPAILELHRLSGLTFEELAGLLGVNRRSLHNWANGRRVGTDSEPRLYRLLAFMRKVDCGEAVRNRHLLLEPDETGLTLFDLLKARRFSEAEQRAERGPGRASAPAVPLSAEAWAARQPPAPAELMGASWEPIATPGRRLLRAKPIRLPRRTAKA